MAYFQTTEAVLRPSGGGSEKVENASRPAGGEEGSEQGFNPSIFLPRVASKPGHRGTQKGISKR